MNRARAATDQSSRCKSGLVSVGISFLRLLQEPWEVNLFSHFQVCRGGGLILVSWAVFFPLVLACFLYLL